MIISMNVSHFVKICQVLTIYTNLSVGVSLILGHGVSLDGTNGLSSFKPCAYCWIVHRADIFAIAQLSCYL